MILHVHPEARAWAPSPVDRARLEAAFPGPSYAAWIEPRRRIGEILGESYAEKPYAFRALTRANHRSIVFVDPTETRESATWVLAHELGHQLLEDHPDHRDYLAAGRPDDLDPASDRFHALDPEELYADGVAARLFGTRLDRAWWRQRTQRATTTAARYGAAPRRALSRPRIVDTAGQEEFRARTRRNASVPFGRYI